MAHWDTFVSNIQMIIQVVKQPLFNEEMQMNLLIILLSSFLLSKDLNLEKI